MNRMSLVQNVEEEDVYGLMFTTELKRMCLSSITRQWQQLATCGYQESKEENSGCLFLRQDMRRRSFKTNILRKTFEKNEWRWSVIPMKFWFWHIIQVEGLQIYSSRHNVMIIFSHPNVQQMKSCTCLSLFSSIKRYFYI